MRPPTWGLELFELFTGLVDAVGVIERVERTDVGRELRIRCRYDELKDGESVAVNGACLTVRESGPGWFDVAAVVSGRVSAGRVLRRLSRATKSAPKRLTATIAMKMGDSSNSGAAFRTRRIIAAGRFRRFCLCEQTATREPSPVGTPKFASGSATIAPSPSARPPWLPRHQAASRLQ